MRIMVTGGAGFIGSNLARFLINKTSHEVLVIDSLSYSGNKETIEDVSSCSRFQFIRSNIKDFNKLKDIFHSFKPDRVIHLAAESHVDKSIDSPKDFIDTNIVGTFNLLECTRIFFKELSNSEKEGFRFIHVSTDEVFGDLNDGDSLFNENSRYKPNSPYSASKASSDHLVRAWNKTYDLPTIITNCSNNYGPFQLPEKLIPLTILNALEKKDIPIYGDGSQIRDWLHVDDHVTALFEVSNNGIIGQTYNIGSSNEKKNIEIVRQICEILDQLKPNASPHEDLIKFVKDRPGHDKRYAVDSKKIQKQLSWKPLINFNDGLTETIKWYLENQKWVKSIEKKQNSRTRQGLKL
jgi:dTDP-glucose 4,6-dehydratase